MNDNMESRDDLAPKKIRFSFAAALAALGGLIVLFGIGLARSYYQEYQIRREIGRLSASIQTLEKKKLASLSILSYVMSADFVEEKARTELNLQKPGERAVVVESLKNNSRSEPAEPSGQERSNPLQWWYYFFGE